MQVKIKIDAITQIFSWCGFRLKLQGYNIIWSWAVKKRLKPKVAGLPCLVKPQKCAFFARAEV